MDMKSENKIVGMESKILSECISIAKLWIPKTIGSWMWKMYTIDKSEIYEANLVKMYKSRTCEDKWSPDVVKLYSRK